MEGEGGFTDGLPENKSCSFFPNEPWKCETILTIHRVFGSLSVIGCSFVMFTTWLFRRYKAFPQRMIFWISLCGAGGGFANVMGESSLSGFCQIIAFINTFFDWGMLLWVAAIAIRMWRAVFYRYPVASRYEWAYHYIIWPISLTIGLLPFFYSKYGHAGAWCWIVHDIGWIMGMWYAPMYLLTVILLVLYIAIIIKIRFKMLPFLRKGPETSLQKDTMKFLKREVRPLVLYPFVYMLMYIVPLGNRIDKFIRPNNPAVFELIVLFAILAPSVGAANSLVYGLDSETRRRLTITQIKNAWWSHFSSREAPEVYSMESKTGDSQTVVKKKFSVSAESGASQTEVKRHLSSVETSEVSPTDHQPCAPQHKAGKHRVRFDPSVTQSDGCTKALHSSTSEHSRERASEREFQHERPQIDSSKTRCDNEGASNHGFDSNSRALYSYNPDQLNATALLRRSNFSSRKSLVDIDTTGRNTVVFPEHPDPDSHMHHLEVKSEDHSAVAAAESCLSDSATLLREENTGMHNASALPEYSLFDPMPSLGGENTGKPRSVAPPQYFWNDANTSLREDNTGKHSPSAPPKYSLSTSSLREDNTAKHGAVAPPEYFLSDHSAVVPTRTSHADFETQYSFTTSRQSCAEIKPDVCSHCGAKYSGNHDITISPNVPSPDAVLGLDNDEQIQIDLPTNFPQSIQRNSSNQRNIGIYIIEVPFDACQTFSKITLTRKDPGTTK